MAPKRGWNAAGADRAAADVVFGLPESEVVAEVRVVLLDDAAAAGGRDDHEIGQALNKLTLLHGLSSMAR